MMIWLVALLLLAQDTGPKIPVYIHHTGDDLVGTRFAYALKETVRASHRYRAVDRKDDALMVIYLASLDPGTKQEKGYQAAIGVGQVLYLRDLKRLERHLWTSAVVVGRDRVQDIAESLLAEIDEITTLVLRWVSDELCEEAAITGVPAFIVGPDSALVVRLMADPALFRKPEGNVVTTGTGSLVMLAGKGRVRVRAGPDSPVERRLETLERAVDQVFKELDSFGADVEAKRKQLSSELTSERQERERRDAELRELMEKFAVGGLHLETTGVIWLIVGVILATLPF